MKRTIKKLAKAVLKHLPVTFSKNQQYDALTLKIIRKVLRSDSSAIDVGAHEGDILRCLLRHAPQGTHYCFEPIPVFAEKLRRNFPEAKIYELALSDSGGETGFQYVVSNPAYSGIRRRLYRGKETIREIKVRTARLDDILPEETPVSFIKIDVEGGEFPVLKGARKLIMRQRPCIVFEHGKGASEFYGTTPADLFDFFTECGLKVSLLDTFLEEKPALTREAFIRQYEEALNYYFIAHP